ncbi:Tyrosine--tRNA ligase, cytoplasmic [Dictyocoela roeselum]|nr:Tyrosine--tRNA ligase, cytoplasmic [Dictyocoela roeselum]
MEIEYNSSYDAIISAFEHLNMPLAYSNSDTREIILKLPGKTPIFGLESVLKTMRALGNMENKPVDGFLSDEIVNKTIAIQNTSQKDLINIYLKKNNPDASVYTFAELVLFFRLYRDRKINLAKNEADWLKIFKEKNKITLTDFEHLEIRVGRILKIWDHPNADSLYVEEVDVGKKIQVVSGLKNVVDKNYLEGKCFLFMVSMKKSKLRGEVSEGMILCARCGDVIKPISAPVDNPGAALYVGAKKFIEEPKKLDKNNEIFKNLMKDLAIENYKMKFGGKIVFCDTKEVICKDVENGIVS